MKSTQNRFWLIFLIIYAMLFVAFLGKNLLEISKKQPFPVAQSSIPSLSVGQLDQISAKLEEREKLNYTEKIDLTKFQFGKTEPFNP